VRLVGVALLLLGLVALVVGTFSGCDSLFTWNGRHPVDVATVDQGPTTRQFVPSPGRRYTVSVQVVFDREGLETHEGITTVEAKMPLVVRVKDPAGTVRAETSSWLDPNVPPNVLYGHAAHEPRRLPPGTTSARGTNDKAMPELVVERLVGPFLANSTTPLSVEIDIGADRVGQARIAERRLVIYDDALPPKIRSAFIGAALGGVAFVAGAVLVVGAWLKRRRASRKRGGIPAPNVV
jgi:hypothetical protein